jgi:DNA-binding NtrC family response regulator
MAGRIMVVDDDPGLLGFTSKYLSRLGYSVTPYRNSEEAWKQFSEPGANYSVVVIDVSLPGLSGMDLSRMMLKADPKVRLVLTSGYPFDTQKLADAGPDRIAFLHKPFTPAMLTETVDRLMRPSSREPC